jgi:hypothetical protein
MTYFIRGLVETAFLEIEGHSTYFL